VSKKNKKQVVSVGATINGQVEAPVPAIPLVRDLEANLVVAQTQTRDLYIYKTMDDVTLSPAARAKSNVWNGFQDFADKTSDSEIDEFSKNFNVDMLGQVQSMARKAIVWMWMIAKARETRRDMTVPKTERTGVKKEGKLTNRKYVVELTAIPEGVKLPPQAIACLKIMVDMNRKEILEQDLKDEVNKQAESLHTRQDPWRIFQYYRPQLMQHKIVRMI
jgi:hypothetical protein